MQIVGLQDQGGDIFKGADAEIAACALPGHFLISSTEAGA
jgi:hypothetical protein